MSETKTAADLAAEIEAEYGTYVAAKVIDIDGVRAFNPGDPVPASHVKRGVVGSDSVKKKNSAAAKPAEQKG